MRRIAFNCHLLTDIVITSNAATEGFHKSLDYIPGSNFLGIVAGQHYDMNWATKTLDLFHNGKVRFGDAHPLIDNQRSHKIPLAYFFPKGESVEDTIYLDFNLSYDDREQLFKDGIVLKQARTGYFSNQKYTNPKQTFAIKSAYDGKKRRAKDLQMYGYHGLKKGTEWRFYVDFDNVEYVSDVISALEGEHRVGRSRSAEYGLVKISKIEDVPLQEQKLKNGRNYIYADSNLCFYNKYLETTGEPTAEDLGLPENATIHWEKSQIRTRIYQTWNRKRFNRDADRLIIEKGSVIAVNIENEGTDDYPQNLGSHRSEGFGQVLLNPDFLPVTENKLPYSLSKADVKPETIYSGISSGVKDTIILNFINRKLSKLNADDEIDELVIKFINDHWKKYKDGPTSSQWGQMRNYANWATSSSHLEKLIFDKDIGFLNRGQTESTWRKGARRDTLFNYIFVFDGNNNLPRHIDKIKFVKVLSAEMAKKASAEK
ncbi:MAG TPA: hypothetical protein ENK85_11635 [Saprospiraceae bacterium]|nr:hypothetical protein [Saprospiraceae bacterium]